MVIAFLFRNLRILQEKEKKKKEKKRNKKLDVPQDLRFFSLIFSKRIESSKARTIHRLGIPEV